MMIHMAYDGARSLSFNKLPEDAHGGASQTTLLRTGSGEGVGIGTKSPTLQHIRCEALDNSTDLCGFLYMERNSVFLGIPGPHPLGTDWASFASDFLMGNTIFWCVAPVSAIIHQEAQ